MKTILNWKFYAMLILILVGCKEKTNKNTKTETKTETTTRSVWSEEKANQWYENQPWLVGANFSPSTAINQLEMWQEETFDPETIDRELGWAAAIGMNTMRVYLHDLLHKQDKEGLYDRMDQYLAIADKHHIRTLFVLFDSCWDPFPALGEQRAPKPHVHNSGWMQSPGQKVLQDASQYGRLESYVKETIAEFKDDDRILGWDLWNEPDNMTGPSYEDVEIPNKADLVLSLLKNTFAWAREANPSQPLTSGVWTGDWSSHEDMKPMHKLQLEQSDIISFHNYNDPEDFEEKIGQLQRYGKPMLCTEYMARPNGSTFEGFLPVAKKHRIGMYNWGLVDGKTQTKYPWDSWTKQYTSEPDLWFHEVFRKDGKPYKKEETQLISELTSEVNAK
ncbi:cellulase family glycosylhydrolase [Sinomicrobium weinanense]|uniref:Cellulase family glycosylhydrolase n=1 Tax=Sinomicrobium weinanense TaxID=2842200 RepID=A0A926JTC1_9FLAO|nr:cellulase family glycosylhydrolase [Sinomicrobium weinanense]MBC9797128.1 cellulase family glycosylhydrolase [Sinomicrobium weinanense]MBU3124829.1 cellulase family glycosylhydrolase [Sinomicrobium weinanense]